MGGCRAREPEIPTELDGTPSDDTVLPSRPNSASSEAPSVLALPPYTAEGTGVQLTRPVKPVQIRGTFLRHVLQSPHGGHYHCDGG